MTKKVRQPRALFQAEGDNVWMSSAAVAEMFNVAPSTVNRWGDQGRLKCTRLLAARGKKGNPTHRRYLREDVVRFGLEHGFISSRSATGGVYLPGVRTLEALKKLPYHVETVSGLAAFGAAVAISRPAWVLLDASATGGIDQLRETVAWVAENYTRRIGVLAYDDTPEIVAARRWHFEGSDQATIALDLIREFQLVGSL